MFIYRTILRSCLVVLLVALWFSAVKEVKAAAPIPTFQAAGTAVSNTTAITVAWPAHQVGDVALLFVESTGGQPATLSTPAGFAAVTSSPQATGTTTLGTQISVFWARATSTSMASPVVADPGDHAYGIILTFRGVINTGNPWDVTAGGVKAAASTTTTFGTVTTTVANTLVVLASTRDNDLATAAWSLWTNANLASPSERSDGGTTSGNGGGIGVATGGKVAAGAVGSSTATVTSTINAFMTIALVPPTTVLANGASEPSNVTIGPGASITDLDNFTLQTTGGTDTVTAATVTLSANSFNNIAQVDLTDTSNVAKCSAVTNPASATISFTGCSIAVTTTATTYKVRITPKSHANMPAIPGTSYATTGTVTALTSTNTQTGTDSGSATVTLDNASPVNVTAATATGGMEQTNLAWVNPVDTDLSGVVILRRASSAVTDAPVEGTTYSVGNTVGSSIVACVVLTPTLTCTDTGLSGGTVYHYNVFALDSRGNYASAGVVPTGSPVTPTSTVVSVTITSDGTVSYGTLAASATKSTVQLSDTQTVKNDGNVNATFNIKTSTATGGTTWSLGALVGTNIFTHEFSTNGGGAWTPFTTADSYQTLLASVAPQASATFDLRIGVPSSSSDFQQKNILVTIQAVAE